MAEFLAVQIRLGKIVLEQVPEKYKADVEEILTTHLDKNAT